MQTIFQFSEHSALLPQGDSYMIFIGNSPLNLVPDLYSSHAGKYSKPSPKLHLQTKSSGCMFEAWVPSSAVVRSLMSCVIKWLYTVTLSWWWTWPVGREELSLPMVLISSVLTDLDCIADRFSTLVSAQTSVPAPSVTLVTHPTQGRQVWLQRLLIIRQRKKLSTSALETMCSVCFESSLRSPQGGKFLWRCSPCSGQVPAPLDTKRQMCSPERVVQVGRTSSGEVEKQSCALTCLSISSHLGWPEGVNSSSAVAHYIVKLQLMTCLNARVCCQAETENLRLMRCS